MPLATWLLVGGIAGGWYVPPILGALTAGLYAHKRDGLDILSTTGGLMLVPLGILLLTQSFGLLNTYSYGLFNSIGIDLEGVIIDFL